MPSLPGLGKEGLTSILKEAGDMPTAAPTPGRGKKGENGDGGGGDGGRTVVVSPLKAAESLNDKLLKEVQ